MNIYPLNILIKERKCLVVGGGKVAARKINSLLISGAHITVVASNPNSNVKLLADNNPDQIELLVREYTMDDLNGKFLVYAATPDRALNRSIIDKANAENILACSVDSYWRHGSFITPASVRKSDITIAVSSHGVACRKTKMIKENIARHISAIENSELFLIGTDHNCLSLNQREPLQLTGESLLKAGRQMLTLWGIHEFILFNTCNRIEMIGVGQDSQEITDMVKMIMKFDTLSGESCYLKSGFEAFRHICLVVAGLYSQTPGENYITAQFKNAADFAEKQNWSGSVLASLRDNIIHVVKHLRNKIIPKMKVFEIDELVVDYLKHRFGSLKSAHIVILGTGTIGRSIQEQLKNSGADIDWIYHSVPPEGDYDNVNIYDYSQIKNRIRQADILISALSSDDAVITEEYTKEIKSGKTFIDLGTPRNIDPALAGNKLLTLTDLEDLKHWHRRENCDLRTILEEADEIINEHRELYDRFKKSFIDGRQGE